jgi:hypothetical protein
MATQARMPSYTFGEYATPNYSTPSTLVPSRTAIHQDREISAWGIDRTRHVRQCRPALCSIQAPH